MSLHDQPSRRDWLASVAMGVGLLVSYGVLAVQGLLFLLPKRLRATTRQLFAGQISQFEIGASKTLYDLEGNPILVRRKSESEFQAFNSTCPHLGCRVRWEEDKQEYFCPCHRGVFDADGVGTAGPPADGEQDLIPVTLRVDEKAGVLFIEVKATKGRRS